MSDTIQRSATYAASNTAHPIFFPLCMQFYRRFIQNPRSYLIWHQPDEARRVPDHLGPRDIVTTRDDSTLHITFKALDSAFSRIIDKIL